jgi:hypothetical protein
VEEIMRVVAIGIALFAGLALPYVVPAPTALAQNRATTTTPAPGQLPPAPPGHRQPRVQDVPDKSAANEDDKKFDRELERKLKSICRGC